ncbi:hypothetical protein CAPTEDRAFT_193159 [Capitella teleta]|uniref:Uncharacterized protein n=1 Tax=Capitella teleta TaxID=283909 RepID=R7UMM4_CAPTE|nr:hypothetical protein CAPTEDRAFT_193159 [Capitella teleta]|eukprot:ELU07789.1 hypothetical protein CAPTEDRAFT_193159 [Capitella teleta]
MPPKRSIANILQTLIEITPNLLKRRRARAIEADVCTAEEYSNLDDHVETCQVASDNDIIDTIKESKSAQTERRFTFDPLVNHDHRSRKAVDVVFLKDDITRTLLLDEIVTSTRWRQDAQGLISPDGYKDGGWTQSFKSPANERHIRQEAPSTTSN